MDAKFPYFLQRKFAVILIGAFDVMVLFDYFIQYIFIKIATFTLMGCICLFILHKN